MAEFSGIPWRFTLRFSLPLYVASASLSWLCFDIGPQWSALPLDCSLHLVLALLLAPLFCRRSVFALFYSLLILSLQFGHAAKAAILGAPLAPDDIYSLRAFLLIIPPWQQLLLLLLALLAGFSLVYGLRITRRRQILALGLLCGLFAGGHWGAGPLLNWLDQHLGYVDWDPAGDFRRRGALLHTAQESLRFLVHRQVEPTCAEVTAVLAERKDLCGGTQADSQRNVHLIVLESFWDAGRLKTALDVDPLPQDFRDLWADAGYSRNLSPVFGGYTANAEFEALCGFPVSEPFVLFERNISRRVDCLPQVLAANGYRSLASHPNVPAFWNRHNVYRRIGFDTFWAGTDFVYDDMNGEYLSDRSLYRQVLEKIEPLLEQNQPVFDYVLTFFGHLPYPLSDDRPLLFESHSVFPEVATYASTLYYKARELMDFLEVLRKRDPDALIVILGDHLPTLGGLGAYAESGLIASEDKADFTPQMHLDMSATPLVIIDGKNGTVPVGDLPTYRLPALILQLLGTPSRTLLAYTEPPAGLQVRPLVGMHLNLAHGDAEACLSEPFSPSCRQSAEWLRQTHLLAIDLFAGAQYALPSPGVVKMSAPTVVGDVNVSLPQKDASTDACLTPDPPEASPRKAI